MQAQFRQGWTVASLLSLTILLTFSASGGAVILAGLRQGLPTDEMMAVVVLAGVMTLIGTWVFPQARRGAIGPEGFVPPQGSGIAFIARGLRSTIGWRSVRLFVVDMDPSGSPGLLRVFTSRRRCYLVSLRTPRAGEDELGRRILAAWKALGLPVLERPRDLRHDADWQIWDEGLRAKAFVPPGSGSALSVSE